MNLTVPLVLASSSPRRRILLADLGLSFTVDPSNVDESLDGQAGPEEFVVRTAEEKAQSVAVRHPDALVLGADTVVLLDGEILGKPADMVHARSMLRRLSGNTNTVYTGLALVHRASDRTATGYEATDVLFSRLTDVEIDRYVESGAPLDKAGGYGIQGDLGALFISGVRGDYFNVVGLPLHRLYTMLKDHFGDLVIL